MCIQMVLGGGQCGAVTPSGKNDSSVCQRFMKAMLLYGRLLIWKWIE